MPEDFLDVTPMQRDFVREAAVVSEAYAVMGDCIAAQLVLRTACNRATRFLEKLARDPGTSLSIAPRLMPVIERLRCALKAIGDAEAHLAEHDA